VSANGNEKTIRFPTPRNIAKSRMQACVDVFRAFPAVLVIGMDLDHDPPAYDFRAPGFDPTRRDELIHLLRGIAKGLEEDESKEQAAQHRVVTPETAQAMRDKAQYAPGTKVKVAVWCEYAHLRGAVGQVVVASVDQVAPDTVTYDVLIGDRVVQLAESDMMEDLGE